MQLQKATKKSKGMARGGVRSNLCSCAHSLQGAEASSSPGTWPHPQGAEPSSSLVLRLLWVWSGNMATAWVPLPPPVLYYIVLAVGKP